MTEIEAIMILEKEKTYMDSHGGDSQSKALQMAIKTLEKQKELKQFIEKMKTPQYDCFVTDRKGVVDILDAFLIDCE